MKKTILIFSALILALLILFQLSEYVYFMASIGMETKITLLAVVFMLMGTLISRQVTRPKTVVQIKEVASPPLKQIDEGKIADLGISKREMEVLQLIAAGHSNKEIAEKLFVSENTIKTHVSRLLSKLDAKRRTEAVRKAEAWRII